MQDRLHDAVADRANGKAEIQKIFDESKPDVDALHSLHGTRPIEFNLQSGSLSALKYLIEEAHASLDSRQSEYGLFHWAGQNTPDILEYLTNPTDKIYKRFQDGTTDLLAFAISGRIDQLIEILAVTPKRITEADLRGQNALYWAEFAGQHETVDFLFTHPAFEALSQKLKHDLLIDMTNAAIMRAKILLKSQGKRKEALIADARAAHHHEHIAEHYDAGTYAGAAKRYYQLGELYFSADETTLSLEAMHKAIACLNRHPEKSEEDYHDLAVYEGMLQIIPESDALSKAARTWGYECNDMPRDGDCFFQAVIAQADFGVDHEDLRGIAAGHLLDHLDAYKDFIIDEAPEDYVEKMATPGTWADQHIMLALSRELNLTLVIIHNNDHEPEIFKRPQAVGTIYLGYEVGNGHYQSLHPLEGCVPDKSIQAKIDAAEPDRFVASPAEEKIQAAESVLEGKQEDSPRSDKAVRPISPLQASQVMFRPIKIIQLPTGAIEIAETPSPRLPNSS